VSVPSTSWFAEMSALTRATQALEAQDAAYEAGDTWSVTIAPERRRDVTVVVARCRCGFSSLPMINDRAMERAAEAAVRHVGEHRLAARYPDSEEGAR